MQSNECEASESASARFHALHPEVWAEFERITMQPIARGYRRCSADGVMHIVRFRTSAGDSGGLFKINNNHVAWYARRFAEAHPGYADFFRFRERRAA